MPDTIDIVCNKCGKTMIVERQDVEGYFNWKCDSCFSIIQLKGCPGIIWNCSTGTAPRRKN